MKTILSTFILFFFFTHITYASESNFFEEGLDFHIKFGGWSKHEASEKYGHFDFNESHMGVGLQVWKGLSNSNWHLGMEYFKMVDSLRYDAEMLGLLGKYQWNFDNNILTSIDFAAGLVYQDRGFLDVKYYKIGNKIEVVGYDSFRDQKVMPALMLTFRWFDFLETDISYVPSTKSNSYPVTFLRLGVLF